MAGKTIAYLNVLLGASNKQLFAALDSSEKKVRRFGQDLERTGANLSMKVTAPLVALGYASVTTASTFSDSMLKVQALSGATADEFKSLEETALHLGRTTRFTGAQVADAMGYMALAGFNTNQTLSATPAILALAAAASTDLAQTSDIVTDTMSAFGIEATRAMEISDLFALTQAKANTNVLQLGEAFKYSAANAASSNQSIVDTASILSVLANAGLKGSSAGTALNAMLRDMKKSSDEGNLSIGKTAIALYDSNGAMRSAIDILVDIEKATANMTQAQRDSALMAIFKEESIRGVNTILNQGSDDLKSYQDQLGNATGSAQKMADLMEGGLGGALRTMRSNLEDVAILIGKNLTPMIQSLSTAIGRMSAFVASLNPETQKMIVYFGLIAAVIPPMILGLGSILTMGTAMIAKFKLIALAAGASTTSLTAFGAALTASIWPITGLIGGLVALSLAYSHLNDNTEINKRVQAEVAQRLKYLNAIKVGAEKISNDLAIATGNLAVMTKEERLALVETTKARILELQTTLAQEKALMNLTGKKALELTLMEKMKAALFSFGSSSIMTYNKLETQAEKYAEATGEASKEITVLEETIQTLLASLSQIENLDTFLDLNQDLNSSKQIAENVKNVFTDLSLELKKISILSDIMGRSYDNVEARTRAYTQAMLDLRVNGVEKTSQSYKDLEQARNLALDTTQAIELSKALQDLVSRKYEIDVKLNLPGVKSETFKSDISGMNLDTFSQISTKTADALFKHNMDVALKQKAINDKILIDKQNFNNSYEQLQNSFLVDMAGDLVAGLGGLLVEGGSGFNQFFSSILSNFGRFLVQMGKMGLVYSGFAQKIKTAFLNPGVGIGASLAMIAVGGAMTAYASKINSTVGSGSSSGGGTGASFNSDFFNQRGYEKSEVEFKIKGDTLVGVLNNTNRLRSRF